MKFFCPFYCVSYEYEFVILHTGGEVKIDEELINVWYKIRYNVFILINDTHRCISFFE